MGYEFETAFVTARIKWSRERDANAAFTLPERTRYVSQIVFQFADEREPLGHRYRAVFEFERRPRGRTRKCGIDFHNRDDVRAYMQVGRTLWVVDGLRVVGQGELVAVNAPSA